RSLALETHKRRRRSEQADRPTSDALVTCWKDDPDARAGRREGREVRPDARLPARRRADGSAPASDAGNGRRALRERPLRYGRPAGQGDRQRGGSASRGADVVPLPAALLTPERGRERGRDAVEPHFQSQVRGAATRPPCRVRDARSPPITSRE